MRGLLWFSAVLLLGCQNGGKASVEQMKYEELHENVRRIVDSAIVEANKYVIKHMDFYSILSEDHSKQMVEVLLTSTPCDKENKKPAVHQKNCEVSTEYKPLVTCVACLKNMNCEFLRNQAKIKKLKQACKHGTAYLPGVGHPMASKDNNEQDNGCLGCI